MIEKYPKEKGVVEKTVDVLGNHDPTQHIFRLNTRLHGFYGLWSNFLLKTDC